MSKTKLFVVVAACFGIAVLFSNCPFYDDEEFRPPVITGITVTSPPVKTTYAIGDESLDLAGLVVSTVYSNGSNKTVENYSIDNNFESETPGSKKITVSYEEFTTFFMVMVEYPLPLTDIDYVLPYLLSLNDVGGSVDNPASLPLQFDLGLMTAIDSNWRKVLTAIAEADKFVNLDLETCTMRGLTENDFLEVIESDIAFYPDYSFATGKNKIVSLILPLSTRIVSAMYHWEAFPPPYPSFHYFDALEFISGEKVDRIDNYAFTDRTNLKNIDFPAARWIYRGAFWGCTSLVSADFPNSTMINFSLFEGCVNLVSVNFPRVTGASIYSDAFKGCTSLALVKIPNATGYYGIRFFSSTGDTGLTIIMGQTAPLPITSLPSYPAEKNIFLGVNSPKTVTVKVPVGATGYDEEWQSNFKYGNTNITVIIEYAE